MAEGYAVLSRFRELVGMLIDAGLFDMQQLRAAIGPDG